MKINILLLLLTFTIINTKAMHIARYALSSTPAAVGGSYYYHQDKHLQKSDRCLQRFLGGVMLGVVPVVTEVTGSILGFGLMFHLLANKIELENMRPTNAAILTGYFSGVVFYVPCILKHIIK